jgi:hypothetical protein
MLTSVCPRFVSLTCDGFHFRVPGVLSAIRTLHSSSFQRTSCVSPLIWLFRIARDPSERNVQTEPWSFTVGS